MLPYDPAKQEPPKLPIYHPGFALTEKLGKEILSAFLDFLKAANLRGIADSEANFLWNEILKKRVIEYQAEIRIAITGDTGSGKSATTNSFLGVDGLTPEVGSEVLPSWYDDAKSTCRAQMEGRVRTWSPSSVGS